ncbi:MAG TPA: FAD-binding protein [Campylobacterales bacterium]|nr:FAD-binding protein [Campylobacterales bacterium]
MKKLKNWARTALCTPKEILYPTSQEEIISLVKSCNETNTSIKVVGAKHSYNDIFCAGKDGINISLEKFNAIVEVDENNYTVKMEAGIRIPRLIKLLKPHNLSLKNLGTNVFDSIAGACSTGYHGSGITHGIFASDVLEFEVITPLGEKKIIKNSDEAFNVYAVGLGMLGVITHITLQCEPFYKLEVVEKKMDFEEIEAQFDTLLAENDHFKFIWIPHTTEFMVWLGNRTQKQENSSFKKWMAYGWTGVFINNMFHELLLFGASFRRSLVPSINRFMSGLLLPKEGEVSTSVYPSHWAFFLPHVLKQDVVEYAFKIEETFDVFRELIAMVEETGIYVDTPIEVRFVKKDDYWLSPTQGEDVCFIGTKIHFPLRRQPEYLRYFTEVDKILLKHSGRPHWGKQFRITTEDFKKNYKKWDKFWEYVDKEDPKGLFANAFSKRLRG